MTFNTAISGLTSANTDLSVIGNNIANASTTGFKSSRTEFADIYASSAAGSGVRVKDVAQQFGQGNLSFTDKELDLAISGNGFFMLDNSGTTEYTRSGIFGVDAEGTIVDSAGKGLRGFQATETGAISGVLSNLVVDTSNIEPSPTTAISAVVNLDASEIEPAMRGLRASSTGSAVGMVRSGSNNGYPSEILSFSMPDLTVRQIITDANASSQEIASQMNAIPGLSASATTSATVNVENDDGGLEVSLNGIVLRSSTGPGTVDAQSLAIAINALTNTTLPGVTAIHDSATNSLVVTSSAGEDLTFSVNNSGSANDRISVLGPAGNSFQLQGNGLGDGDNDGDGAPDGTANDGFNATVGGTVAITMDEGITLDTVLNDGLATDDGSGLFPQDIIAAPFVENSFDPNNQDSFNHSTSVNIFDSLGNSHVMNMYFVKESAPNTWTAYVQIDGQNVGEPNPALDPPLNTEPTLASYSLRFNSDGSLDLAGSEPVNISYWNPTNADGEPTGALMGVTTANGAVFPLEGPITSSNFSIDLDDVTQFGSDFAVQDIAQNGYTTGRLTGIDIADDGTIFRRFTNGEARVLGQVALANFANFQGLQPVGSTAWTETFASGAALVGVPGSASLGQLQAGAVEESNVDLSKELVALIIAQRNFQANSKTIQTADTMTQSLINMR